MGTNQTPTTTFAVVYGSYTLNTSWVLGTFSTIRAAMAKFEALASIRHSDEWISIETLVA